jgi:hypothetical protein
MSDDLVKRLRNHCFSTDWQVAVADAREAADLIEELEAALRESYKFEETLMRISHLADQHPVFDDALKAYTRCASIARAALGEKKDV